MDEECNKLLSDSSGSQLLRSCTNKRVFVLQVWQNSVQFSAQSFFGRAVVEREAYLMNSSLIFPSEGPDFVCHEFSQQTRFFQMYFF